jgi:hypothetical protein
MLDKNHSLLEAEIQNDSKVYVNLEIEVPYPLPPAEGYITKPR